MFDLVDKLDRLFPVPNTVPRGVDDLVVLRGPKKPSYLPVEYMHQFDSFSYHIARETLIGQEDVTIKADNWVVIYGPQRS